MVDVKDQQAAEDKDKKRLEWIKIIQSDKYAVRSKESKLIASIEAGLSFDYGYDAGAAHKEAQLRAEIDALKKRVWELENSLYVIDTGKIIIKEQQS